MARIKEKPKEKLFDVAAGLSFEPDIDETETEKNAQTIINRSPVEEKGHVSSPGRTYSKYYTPKPQIGARGGILGRPPIEEDERKIQFSVSCTKGMKERYQRAAKADGKKFPDFVNTAIREYIENHNL